MAYLFPVSDNMFLRLGEDSLYMQQKLRDLPFQILL